MRGLLIGLAILTAGLASGGDPAATVEAARAASVVVEPGDGYGTGVVFKNGKSSFVWTAAHVVGSAQKVRVAVDERTGQPFVSVSYDDVSVSTEDVQGGRKIGETRRLAKVVRYGYDEDLALLLVYEEGYGKASAKFLPSAPRAGAGVWHVGSFHGKTGAGSVGDGVVAAVGRLRSDGMPSETKSPVVCDQVSVVAHPGSSGGGVFLKDTGECVGIVSTFLSIKSPFFTYGSFCVVPSRRVFEFAKRTRCEWAVDPSVKVPSVQEIMAGRVTDTPVPLPKDFPGAEPKKCAGRNPLAGRRPRSPALFIESVS